jgi:hypothetical protein
MSKDYSSYEDYDDRHAKGRETKKERERTDSVMRGGRSVFEIQKSQLKRARSARRKENN